MTSSKNVAKAPTLAKRCASMNGAEAWVPHLKSREPRSVRRATTDRRPVELRNFSSLHMWSRLPGCTRALYSRRRRGMAGSWTETTSVGTLRSDDLAKANLVFRYNRYVYRTNGQHLSNGGMGTVYELDRRDDETGAEERVVGKVFHSNYLYQLRTDEVTRRDHHNNLAAMARIAAIEHPNILPTYVSAPIADNYLFVTPRMGVTLLEAITKHNLTPRARCKLLVQALEGLSTLHSARLIHRDFTLRNIPVDDGANVASLFDFHPAMSPDDIPHQTARHYFTSPVSRPPGCSGPPGTI